MNDRQALQALLDGEIISHKKAHPNFWLQLIGNSLKGAEGFVAAVNGFDYDWIIKSEIPRPSKKEIVIFTEINDKLNKLINLTDLIILEIKKLQPDISQFDTSASEYIKYMNQQIQ